MDVVQRSDVRPSSSPVLVCATSVGLGMSLFKAGRAVKDIKGTSRRGAIKIGGYQNER